MLYISITYGTVRQIIFPQLPGISRRFVSSMAEHQEPQTFQTSMALRLAIASISSPSCNSGATAEMI